MAGFACLVGELNNVDIGPNPTHFNIGGIVRVRPAEFVFSVEE